MTIFTIKPHLETPSFYESLLFDGDVIERISQKLAKLAKLE